MCVCVCVYVCVIYIVIYCIYISGGKVHVFPTEPSRYGHLGSVHEALRRIQAIPNPEGGARSNATLFDNRQQNNSECQRMPWVAHLKTKPTSLVKTHQFTISTNYNTS